MQQKTSTSKRGVRLAVTATTLCFVLASPLPTHAGSVQIRSSSAPGIIDIEASNAPIDDILHQLGKHQDINVERVGTPAAQRNWSGRLTGRVDSILGKLLDSENFTIEHANTAKSGIARVRIFAAAPVDAAAVTAAPVAIIQPQRKSPVPLVAPVAPSQPGNPAIASRSNSRTPANPPTPTIANTDAANKPAVVPPISRSQPGGFQRRGGVAP